MSKRAVCIGINYANTPNALSGCINDAHSIKALLVSQYGYAEADVRLLLDDDPSPQARPTRANILAAMAWLVKDVQPGDRRVLSYSGHGSHVRDTNNDEHDRRDEVLCAVDGFITDDEIFQTLVRPVPQGAKLACFFDCCHSGSICDLRYNYKCSSSSSPHAYQLTLDSTSNVAAPGDVTMFSGCYDAQTSMDVSMGGKPCGAFTFILLQVLRTHQYKITHCDALAKINALLKAHRFEQVSQFSSSSLQLFEAAFAL